MTEPRATFLRPLAITLALALFTPPAEARPPVRIGLDHIPLAVSQLDSAAAAFQALGFTLKPGRDHANGIRNAHVKFPDGAGIELITVPKGVDALSTHYWNHLQKGDGPAFVSFHARDTGRLHEALRDGGYTFEQRGEITTLSAPEFAFLFLVRDNRSPGDRPEHFAHANGATALRSVWIATEHGAALARLLETLGGRARVRTVAAPDSVEATVVELDAGEVVLLPAERQVVPGRPVIGAGFRVRGRARADRILIEPERAHGLWIEFVAGETPESR